MRDNLTKYVQNLSNENQKPLLREIKEGIYLREKKIEIHKYQNKKVPNNFIPRSLKLGK